MTNALFEAGFLGGVGVAGIERNRVINGVALQRADTDPISTPDLVVTLQNAQTTADVPAARVLVYRESDNSLEGSTASGGPSVTISSVGFYGAGSSGLVVVVLKAGFRPARVTGDQEPDGATINVQLIPDVVYQSGTVLNPGAVVIDTGAKTLQLTEAVEGQDLYSYLVDQWIADANYPATVFPQVARAAASYEIQGGWDFDSDTSRDYVRGAGWLVKNTSDVTTAIYSNVTTLGTIDAAEVIRYQQVSEGTVNAWPAGHVDRALLVYVDSDGNGTPETDYTGFLRVIVDTYGRTRSEVNVLTALGESSLGASSYPVALSTAVDSKVTANDATVDGTAPYTSMSLTYEAVTQSRTVGSDTSDYFNTIEGNSATPAQVYTWFRRQQRKTGTVGSGAEAVNGWDTPSMLEYVGDELFSRRTNSRGCFVNALDSSLLSTVTLTDDAGDENAYPDFPTVTITFSANLVGGTWILVTDATYPGASAVHVTDSGGSQVDAGGAGNIAGTSVSFTYDHDAGGDLAVVAVAVNKGTGRWVEASGTITASGLALTLTADDETADAYPAAGGAGSTVDGGAKTLTPPGGFTAGNYNEIYRDGVDWQHDSGGLVYGQMWRVSGGDDLGGGTTTDIDFFLQVGWSIVLNQGVTFEDGATNLRLEGGAGSPFTAGSGVVLALAPSSRRGLVQETAGLSGTTADRIGVLTKSFGLEVGSPVTSTITKDAGGTVVQEVTEVGTIRRTTAYSGDTATRTRNT